MNKKITMEELLEDWHSKALEIDGNDKPTQQSTIYVQKLRELCEQGMKWGPTITPIAYRNSDGETYYTLRIKGKNE